MGFAVAEDVFGRDFFLSLVFFRGRKRYIPDAISKKRLKEERLRGREEDERDESGTSKRE